MSFVISADGSFLKSFNGSYIASSDTSFLTLTGPTATGTISVAYSSSIGKTGTTPWTFTIIDGSLPTGLSINGTTGAITGTPTVLGMYTFTVQVIDSLGATQIAEYSITILTAPNAKSGIYTIVPTNTHDQLYLDITVPTTQNVKIPNPFAETALLGDE